MLRKVCFLFCAVSFCAVLLLGCETTKGVAVGIGATAQGAAKDTVSLWQTLVKCDNWLREKLW